MNPWDIATGDIVFFRCRMLELGIVTARVTSTITVSDNHGESVVYKADLLSSTRRFNLQPGIPVAITFTQDLVLDVLKKVRVEA